MFLRSLALLFLLSFYSSAAESDAVAISANIQAQHLPYGAVLDPIFAAADSDKIVGYTRCGDSAIWTGHYLAAESFRYKVTKSSLALANVKSALAALQLLVDVTGNDVLARCAIPVDSPFAPGIVQEESHNGIHIGAVNLISYNWIGNTSRDQYSGVFFGLGVAYDMVDDVAVRGAASSLITRLLNNLLGHAWSVVISGFDISTTFLLRPDQQLSLLATAQHVNGGSFRGQYRIFAANSAPLATTPIALEATDPTGSYFKFNLDAINLFQLLRLDDNWFRSYYSGKAYDAFRGAVSTHQNAHFNMIDHALRGKDSVRDAETVMLLNDWLLRPRRDLTVDLRGKYKTCHDDNTACSPIPVALRPPTDFLWQRSPFQLSGGGSGLIESAGIDYILPYWMARYYRVLSE